MEDDISWWLLFVFPWLVMVSIFPCTCWPFVCLLWKKSLFSPSVQFLTRLFGFLLLSYMNSWCILDINSLSGMLLANMFYHFIGCLSFCWWFPLLCRSFLVQCSPTWLFFGLLLVIFMLYPKIIAQNNVKEIFPYIFF